MQPSRRNLSSIYMTVGIICACIFMFFMETVLGGSQNIGTLINLGAMNNMLVVIKQQWWRLLTAQFLHIGIWHLVSNIVMIYYMGMILEPMIGHFKFLSIYLLSGIGGNLFSLAFDSDQSVGAGASTALFGLFGIAIAIGIQYRFNPSIRYIAKQALTLAIINLFIDVFLPYIDLWGHLGGLVTGFLLCFAFDLTSKDSRLRKIACISLVLLIVMAVFLVNRGLVISY